MKVRHVRRDPGANLAVFESRPAVPRVEARGQIEVSTEDVRDARRSIAIRYAGLELGTAYAAPCSHERYPFRLRPDHLRVWERGDPGRCPAPRPSAHDGEPPSVPRGESQAGRQPARSRERGSRSDYVRAPTPWARLGCGRSAVGAAGRWHTIGTPSAWPVASSTSASAEPTPEPTFPCWSRTWMSGLRRRHRRAPARPYPRLPTHQANRSDPKDATMLPMRVHGDSYVLREDNGGEGGVVPQDIRIAISQDMGIPKGISVPGCPRPDSSSPPSSSRAVPRARSPAPTGLAGLDQPPRRPLPPGGRAGLRASLQTPASLAQGDRTRARRPGH